MRGINKRIPLIFMPSACDPLKESYVKSRMYKHRYKDRPLPKRCKVIKRNGEQCRNWALPGLDVCKVHGGAAARKNLKHGLQSKMVKTNIMHYLQSLTPTEKKAVSSTDYSIDKVLNSQVILADVLIGRGLKYQRKCKTELGKIERDLENNEYTGNTLDAKLKRKSELEKSVLNIHRLVDGHMKTIRDSITTREQLHKDITANEALKKIQGEIDDNPIETLAEAIESCIAAGIVDNLDQVKLLVEQRTEERETVVYDYANETT